MFHPHIVDHTMLRNWKAIRMLVLNHESVALRALVVFLVLAHYGMLLYFVTDEWSGTAQWKHPSSRACRIEPSSSQDRYY
jgi:hypothetical protein